MIYSRTLWFFANEVEQEEGPFLSEEDAKEARTLYAKALDIPLNETETARYEELSGRWNYGA